MDTEWDKKVLRYVLSSVRCYSEIKELGFDVHNVKQLCAEMKSFQYDLNICRTEIEPLTFQWADKIKTRSNFRRMSVKQAELCLEDEGWTVTKTAT